MKNIILKITAWFILILSSLFGLGILSLIFFLPLAVNQANPVKMVSVDMGIFLIAAFVFILGLGFFEFILSFIKVEEEIIKIEDEIESIEGGIKVKNIAKPADSIKETSR